MASIKDSAHGTAEGELVAPTIVFRLVSRRLDE